MKHFIILEIIFVLSFFLQCIANMDVPLKPTGDDEFYGIDEFLLKRIRQKFALLKKELEESKFAEEVDYNNSDDNGDELVATTSSEVAQQHSALSRNKRATITADNPLLLGRQRRKTTSNPISDDGIYLLRNVFRISPQYFDHVKTLDINSLLIQNQTFLFFLEQTEHQRTEIVVSRVGSGLNPIEIARMDCPGATSLEVIQIDKQYYILPLVYNWTENNSMDPMDVGSNLLRLDMVRRSLVKVQTIRTAYARSSVFWQGSGEEANNVFLAVAPEFIETKRGKQYRVKVPCYRWQGGYFDYVSTVFAKNPKSIRHFNILSNDYLAIANYQDDTGSTNIHSEIFKYNHKESRFVSFQKIRTQGAVDMQHFSFKNGKRLENFLVVANHCSKTENGGTNYRVKSFIMKFASQRFIPFKSIYTYGALQFLPISLDGKFYLVLAEIQHIRIFQYNGWSFVSVKKIDLTDIGPNFSSMKLRPFFYENEPYFAVSSINENYHGGWYSVQFEQKNDYKKLANGLEQWCITAGKRLNEINLTKIENEVDQAPKLDQKEIVLKHDLIFKGRLISPTVSTENTKYRGKQFDENFMRKLYGLENGLEGIRNEINDVEGKISNAVFRNKDHEINGKVVFEKLEYDSPKLGSTEAFILTMSNVNLSHLVKNLVLTNRDMNLTSLIIEQAEFPEEAKLTTSILNGAPITDFALLDNPLDSKFKNDTTFSKYEVIIGGEIGVEGLFAGVNFSEPEFVLAQTNQTFTKIMKLSNSTANSLTTKHLNGENIVRYFEDAVPLDGEAVITAPKTFKSLSVHDLHAIGPVNGISIEQLYLRSIYTNGKDLQEFNGTTRFNQANMEHLPTFQKLVNGKYDLEKDFINIQYGEYELGDITFTYPLFVEELNVTSKLNKLDVVNGDFGVVLKDSSRVQRIKNKNLLGIHFDVDVEAPELFDGVNLNIWNSTKRFKLRTNSIHRKFTIYGNLTAPKTKVTRNFVQEFNDILGIIKHISLLNSTKLPGSCELEFEDLTVIGDSDLKKDINGINPNSWLQTNAILSQNITGKKNFLGNIYLENDCFAKGLFGANDANAENILDVIPDLLIDGKDQAINGGTLFKEKLYVEKLDCPNIIIDEIPFENLLLKSVYQEIEVATDFRSLVKIDDGIQIYGDLWVGLVNSLNLTGVIDDTLRTGDVSHTQIVQGEYNFEGGLTVNNLQTDGYFGRGRDEIMFDLGALFDSLVLKSRRDTLHLYNFHLTFENSVEIESFQYDGKMNGIPSTNWGEMWLLKTGNQTVYRNVMFQDNLIVDSGLYSQSGRVNDIDIMRFDKEMIKINEGGQLKHVIFLEEVDAQNGIHMNNYGTVNGMDLTKDVLHKTKSSNSENVVTGFKIFQSGLNISSGNLEAPNINGMNLNTVLRFMYEKDPNVFKNHTLIVKGNMKLKNEPIHLRSLNGKDLYYIISKIWFTNQDVVLNSRVNFEDVDFIGGSQFSESDLLLQGVDLEKLKREYVSKTNNQTWTAKVTFDDSVKFNKLYTHNLQLAPGLLNDVDITNFANSVWTSGANETLNGNLNLRDLRANNIFIKGGPVVNDLDLTKDILSTHGHKNILTERDIQNLTAHEVILNTYRTTINGINITEWDRDAVKTYGENALGGQMELENLENSNDIMVEGLVDGVKVDKEHILLKNGSQVIPGKMMLSNTDNPNIAAFKAPEGVIVDGYFNNYDLNTTFQSLVRKSETDNDTSTPLIISGEKKFLSPIRIDHIKTEKLFKGINLTQVLNDFYSGLVIPPSLAFRANDHYEALHSFASQAYRISARRAVFLEYFVFSQEIIHKGLAYTRMLYGTRLPTLVLGIQESDLRATESWWIYSPSTDFYQKQLGERLKIQGRVRDSIEVQTNETGNFIILSVQSVKNQTVTYNLETRRTGHYSEMNKGIGQLSKTLILRSVTDSRIKTGWVVSQTIFGKDFGPLEYFIISKDGYESHCILTTTLNGSNSSGDIYCLQKTQMFMKYQSIPLDHPTLTSTLEAFDRTFLMFSTKGVKQPERVIEVWTHINGSTSFKKESCIPVFNPVKIDSTFGSNNNPFLVVASGAISHLKYLGAVFIYRYSIENKQFEKVQTIEVDFPLEVRLYVLQPSNEVVLFILTQTPMNNILMYKYQGVSGWILRHKWTSENAQNLEIADFDIQGIYKTQVIISSPNRTQIYTAEFKGLSDKFSNLPEDDTDNDLDL